jgi:diguanylate cyclase (GGDEF)-like protein
LLRDRRSIDGAAALAVFRPIAGTSLFAFAAVREDTALAPYRSLERNILGFAAIAMLAISLPIVLIASRSLREMRRLARLEQRYAEERQLARTDPLTGLANRSLFDEHHRRLHERVGATGPGYVLAIIDVDRFKALNDSRGHHAGDAALQQIAASLISSLRSADCVARIGGDEFGVLMPGCSAENAGPVLVRLHRALQLASSSADLNLGYSIGAVGVNDASASAAVVRSEADALMYATKREGGGVRVAAWQDGMLATALGGYSPLMRHAA